VTREQYQQYLESFNGKDYDRVLDFWAPEFSVWVQGELLFDSPEGLKRTYAFLHAHVTEEVRVKEFLSSNDRIFIEADVRIIAQYSFTNDDLKVAGVRGIMPMQAGVALDIPQFIHYHLENGLFKTGTCLISEAPRPVI
jgi:hypothetical protein